MMPWFLNQGSGVECESKFGPCQSTGCKSGFGYDDDDYSKSEVTSRVQLDALEMGWGWRKEAVERAAEELGQCLDRWVGLVLSSIPVLFRQLVNSFNYQHGVSPVLTHLFSTNALMTGSSIPWFGKAGWGQFMEGFKFCTKELQQ